MIPNYSFPQATIAQVLETTANPLLDRLHAVVVGPAYVHADMASENLVWGTYEQNAILPYLRAGGLGPAGGEVDQPAVRLLAQRLLLTLFSRGTATAVPANNQFMLYEDNPTGDLLQYNNPAGFMNTGDPAVVEAFDFGRPPTIGDLYRITSNLPDSTVERRVVGIVGQDMPGEVGNYGYSGALPWVNSGENEEITVLSSNVTIDPTFASPSSAMELEARRKGAVAPEGGLRMILSVTCLTSGTGTAATFSGTLNGMPTAVTSATSGTNTNFTVLGSIITVNLNAWAAGDRFVLALDFANDGDIQALTDNVDLSALSYNDSIRRLGSTLVVETLEVTASDITVRLSDTSGLSSVTTRTITGDDIVELPYDGSMIYVELPAALITSSHVGQRYTALIKPASRSATVFDKVRLSAPVGMEGAGAGVAVVALLPFSGAIPAEEPILGNVNYTVGPQAVTLATIQHAVSGYTSLLDSVRPAVDGSGSVALEWRATIPVGSTEGLFPVDSNQDIIDALGSDALASELGFGLSKALSGSQGKRVYGLNTGGASRAAFQAAILKLESANYIYAIAALTSDEVIMRDFSQHARLQSRKEIKRFRRVYVGTDSPGEYPILDVKEDGTPYLAAISMGDNGFNLVTFSEDVGLDMITISRGDKLVIPGTNESYPIDRITGPDTLVLAAGPSSAVAETTVQVIAADTPENVGRFVYGRSQRIGTNAEERRRINNVWTDNGIYDDGIGTAPVIPNRFGAAEIAGLRTAIQPQQSLTRTEVSYITDAPSMFTRFNTDVLNMMAANGVWIITQNSPDSTPHVRHQITAEVSSGSLFYEDSAGVNIDSVCFAIDDIVDPLIGKRNATNRTVIEIKNLLLTMLNDTTEAAYDSIIGPQVVDFYNLAGDRGTLDVAIDPVLKDTINVDVVLEIPLPLNNIRVTVLARTIRLDGGTVVNSLTVTPVAA